MLLLSGRGIEWILVVFALWVPPVSAYILVGNLRPPSLASARALEEKKHD